MAEQKERPAGLLVGLALAVVFGVTMGRAFDDLLVGVVVGVVFVAGAVARTHSGRAVPGRRTTG